jgi:APA family basic amino acid/polyamine antiporter
LGAEKQGLSKSLGVVRLSLYGVGTIIGAGIYSVIGPAAESAGASVWASFLVAAFISALTGLSYAELASALPNAGAEHNFLRQAFPKIPAFAFAVGLFIALHGAATFATVGLTFGSYLRIFVDTNATLVAVGLMAAATLVNISGLKRASTVGAILTVVQVGALTTFAGVALTTRPDSTQELFAPVEDWSGVLTGAAIAFFIYSGYEHMATMSEEAKNPDRDIWRAFMIALVATTSVYFLVIIAVQSLVDVRALQTTEFPLIEAAKRLGNTFGIVIGGAALLATANAVLSASLSGSRLLFGMARTKDLPRPLGATVGTSQSPWVAALLFFGTATVFAILGEIKFVASLSSLGVTFVFASVNVAVIVLRFTKPKMKRPFSVPSLGRVPITAVLGAITALVLATRYEWKVYVVFIGAVVVGMGMYAAARQRGRSKAA